MFDNLSEDIKIQHKNKITHPILIIEDDEDIRDLMKAMLEAEGYHPFTASNGEEGFTVLSEISKPCMILLDMMMPIMDGWTFSDEIKKNSKYQNIPLLAVTAFAEQITAKEKFIGVLKKPVRLESLLNLVKQHCSSEIT